MANDMITKHGTNRLLHTLYELYYMLCDRDLRKRMSIYHRNTSTNDAPDISTSVINNFDKLAPDQQTEQRYCCQLRIGQIFEQSNQTL